LKTSSRGCRPRFPTSAGAYNREQTLADLLVQLSRRDEAVTVLDLALAQHPDDSVTAIHYLETLMAARPEKAPEAAHRLLLVFPQNSKLLYLNGILDRKAGNLEQARAHLQQSLALQPDDALSHEVLGLVLTQLNQMTGAKEHLQRAIALGENGPEVKESLKRVLQALGTAK
jgi:Flp pilus assembly protein TadD